MSTATANLAPAGTQLPGPNPATPANHSLSAKNNGTGKRRALIGVGFGLVIVLLLATTVLLRGFTDPTTKDAFAPDSIAPDGGRAIAQILQAHGVDVHRASTMSEVGAALNNHPHSAVFIPHPVNLDTAKLQEIIATGQSLIIADPHLFAYEDFEFVADTVVAGQAQSVTAQCQVSAALQAGELSPSTAGLVPKSADMQACFPLAGTDAYVLLQRNQDQQLISLVASWEYFSNAHLASAGNAALAVNLLGSTTDLIWYTPTQNDHTTLATPLVGGLEKRLAGLELATLVCFVVFAFWRGRRLGPVVEEKLPVVVPAGETIRGRGRLYQRNRAFAHTASAFRAATATRISKALNLSPQADADVLIIQTSYHSSLPAPQIRELFYGPAPTNAAQLNQLVSALAALEKEVQQR